METCHKYFNKVFISNPLNQVRSQLFKPSPIKLISICHPENQQASYLKVFSKIILKDSQRKQRKVFTDHLAGWSDFWVFGRITRPISAQVPTKRVTSWSFPYVNSNSLGMPPTALITVFEKKIPSSHFSEDNVSIVLLEVFTQGFLLFVFHALTAAASSKHCFVCLLIRLFN